MREKVWVVRDYKPREDGAAVKKWLAPLSGPAGLPGDFEETFSTGLVVDEEGELKTAALFCAGDSAGVPGEGVMLIITPRRGVRKEQFLTLVRMLELCCPDAGMPSEDGM